MNRQIISDAFALIDDAYIEECIVYRSVGARSASERNVEMNRCKKNQKQTTVIIQSQHETKRKGEYKMSKIVEANEKIAEKVVEGYKKIEQCVVTGYKKVETGVVDGFNKVSDKCVETLFAKEGESVEDAKKRLSDKNDNEEK